MKNLSKAQPDLGAMRQPLVLISGKSEEKKMNDAGRQCDWKKKKQLKTKAGISHKQAFFFFFLCV